MWFGRPTVQEFSPRNLSVQGPVLEINAMARQKGFTLVELVVVVMILGILAAVAAPKLLNTSQTATQNGAKQTLSVIRDAIERYAAAKGGSLPTAPATELIDEQLLRAPFPKCPIGTNATDATVAVESDGPGWTFGGTQGWRYDSTSGEFVINDAAYSSY
jgi:general secretion pathway protein G